MPSDGRIRIVQVLEATWGGTRKHLLYLATRLDRSRFDITVLCSTRRNPSFAADIEALRNSGVKVEIIQMERELHPISDFAALVRIYAFLKKNTCDIVHAHSSKAGFLGRIAARLARVPAVIYTPHAFSFDRGILGTNRFYLLLERFAARFADVIVAVSEGEREIALRHRIARGDAVVTIVNGIDCAECRPRVDAQRLKRELGIGDAAKVVGMVGRIAVQKGYSYFLEAAARVARLHPGVAFVLVGDGNLDEARSRIARAGAAGTVVMTGQRDDLPDLYAVFDAVVVPSLWEGLPYVILEAMAMGRPVIATDIPGNRDVVVDGATGYLVPPGDTAALVDAIVRLLDDADGAAAMGIGGRRRIEQRYTLEENIRSHERLYEEVLSAAGADVKTPSTRTRQ